ncbi:MAG: thioredoxin domain-containing protein [Hyphomicrobiales bacterium]
MTSSFSRRSVLQGTGAAAALVTLSGCFSSEANNSDLAQPGPLKEMTIGNKDAKVKVIEYASMTCPHCASFHTRTYHAFKEKYVDTGKVLFAFREFPLDQVAATVAVLARCAPEDKFFDIVDVFFKTQPKWRNGQNPLPGIVEIAKQVGFTQQSFNACLQNKEVIDGINKIRTHGAEVLKVEATPTFYINDKKISGSLSLEAMDKEIEGLL